MLLLGIFTIFAEVWKHFCLPSNKQSTLNAVCYLLMANIETCCMNFIFPFSFFPIVCLFHAVLGMLYEYKLSNSFDKTVIQWGFHKHYFFSSCWTAAENVGK